MKRIRQFLSGRPRPFIVGVALALGLVFGVLDRFTDMGDSLWVLLLVPVALATWYADWRWGLAVAATSLLVPILPNVIVGGITPPASSGVEILVRMGLLLVFVYVLSEGKSATAGRPEPVRI